MHPATSWASPESIYFFDSVPGTNPNDSLYFTDQNHTGPVFAFWEPGRAAVLIDNARVLPRRVSHRRIPLRSSDW